MLGRSPKIPQSAAPAADQASIENILTSRGYRYVPDPMGRIGWGDWIDSEGRPLDEKQAHAIVTRDGTLGHSAQVDGGAFSQPNSNSSQTGTRGLGDLDSAQTAAFMRSDLGARLAEARNRISEAALLDGVVPVSVWHDELRKLGIEPGQIGSPPSGVTLVQHPGDQKERSAETKRTPQSFLAKAWAWLTDEFPGLAEEKAQAISRLDCEIKAIESEPGWRRNILSLYARQSLLEARTGIIGGFPTSRLDFIFAGIDVIGVGMVGGRPLAILRKGNKIITSADLAEGGFRSRHALELGKDVPYNSYTIRVWLEQRFGAGTVTSTTIPRADYRLVQLAGKRHPATGIVFDSRGYPIFDDVARFDTRIPSTLFWKGGDKDHKRHAVLQLREAITRGQIDPKVFTPSQIDDIFRGSGDITGFRWHHHQDLGRLQLVPKEIHERTRHLGGMGLRDGK